jgi:hypothetical protein
MIWIDVHPTGEIQPIYHMHPTLSLRMVLDHMFLTRSMHNNLSRSPHEVETGSYTRQKSWRPKQTGLAIVLGHLILPPS